MSSPGNPGRFNVWTAWQVAIGKPESESKAMQHPPNGDFGRCIRLAHLTHSGRGALVHRRDGGTSGHQHPDESSHYLNPSQ